MSDPRKNQISDITCSQKSDIWHIKIRYQTPKKINYQISHPLKKSNIRYQGTPVPPPPPSMHAFQIYYGHRMTLLIHELFSFALNGAWLG